MRSRRTEGASWMLATRSISKSSAYRLGYQLGKRAARQTTHEHFQLLRDPKTGKVVDVILPPDYPANKQPLFSFGPEGQLQGHMILERLHDKLTEIQSLKVQPEFRGRGIATNLLEVAKRLTPAGQRLAVIPDPYATDETVDMDRLVNLYKRVGFAPTTDYDDPGKEKLPVLAYDQPTEKAGSYLLGGQLNELFRDILRQEGS